MGDKSWCMTEEMRGKLRSIERTELRRENLREKWHLMINDITAKICWYLVAWYHCFSQRKVTWQTVTQLAMDHRGIQQVPHLPSHKENQASFSSDWYFSDINKNKQINKSQQNHMLAHVELWKTKTKSAVPIQHTFGTGTYIIHSKHS